MRRKEHIMRNAMKGTEQYKRLGKGPATDTPASGGAAVFIWVLLDRSCRSCSERTQRLPNQTSSPVRGRGGGGEEIEVDSRW